MLGSLDCMHWEWKNCPKAHHGSYKGKEKKPTIALEAVASYDLWIWHAFSGATGSLNDLNILARSPLFDQLVDGGAPSSSFEVNGHRYDMGYYLVDGIYPEYSTFKKIIPSPQKRRHQIFAAKQEAARKDVERAFGVLQARFNILKDPVCLWHTKSLQDVMMACIILHNMIVEDQQEDDVGFDERALEENNISSYVDVHKKLRDKSVYQQLQNDLVDHLFKIYSNQPI